MPRVLEAREICERALRKIGSYSIRDASADGTEMAEARFWLDMIVGHIASRQRTWWLVPGTARLTVTAGVTSYDLQTNLTGLPKVQHVVSLYSVAAADGTSVEIPLLRRQEWEALDRSDTATGQPTAAYVDRRARPTLLIWPAPAATPTHNLDVLYQQFSDDSTAKAVTAPLDRVRESWNLFLVTRLAADIGNGPIRKLPADEVREMQTTAAALLFDLEAYDSQEQAGEPRLVAYNDF